MKIKKKLTVMMLLVALIFNIIPIGAVQAATGKSKQDDVSILSSPIVSLSEAKKWAKDNNATDVFVNLADLFWKYAPDHGGVNPAIAYAQSALETNWGRFGNILDESYHNTCGMKISVTSGDSDTDKNQHQRFDTWDDGVKAHLDHLALYAGANGYPRKDTLDPRHFPYLLGKATTIMGLDGWATGSNYGAKVYNLYQRMLISSGVIVLNPEGDINEPSDREVITANTLYIRGWALNKSGIDKINIYIDNVLKGSTKLTLNRPDVEKAYPKYPNALTSGYETYIDVSGIDGGRKVLTIEEVGKDGSINKRDRIITLNQPKGLSPVGDINEPSEQLNIYGGKLYKRMGIKWFWN